MIGDRPDAAQLDQRAGRFDRQDWRQPLRPRAEDRGKAPIGDARSGDPSKQRRRYDLLFITPYPVARSCGRTTWQRMGMLLQSKKP